MYIDIFQSVIILINKKIKIMQTNLVKLRIFLKLYIFKLKKKHKHTFCFQVFLHRRIDTRARRKTDDKAVMISSRLFPPHFNRHNWNKSAATFVCFKFCFSPTFNFSITSTWSWFEFFIMSLCSCLQFSVCSCCCSSCCT